MQPEGSQASATGPYAEPDDPVHTFSLYFPNIHTNQIFQNISFIQSSALPNVVNERLPLLFRILEVSGSSLGLEAGCPN